MIPSKFEFLFERLRERLWIRPLLFCIAAVVVAFAASAADRLGIDAFLPRVDHDTVEKILSIIAASMLGVATFAVASMVSAYASTSTNATPRAFRLVISDDGSKTVLSTFVAAFIFSVVALIAIKTGYYGRAALFTVFVVTIAVLAWVIFSFIRWVDQIARLGRLGTTIDRVEKAAATAIDRQRRLPHFGALPVEQGIEPGLPIFGEAIGYVQHIDVAALQAFAEKHESIITIAVLPGTFMAPGRALAFLRTEDARLPPAFDASTVAEHFMIGGDRSFEQDPRFGLIVLSEIAARALSPAINDAGTAIDIIGTFVRVLARWVLPAEEAAEPAPKFDRVRVPSLDFDDLFDDAFTAIARDGAGAIEVAVRLQKAFLSLSTIEHQGLRGAAIRHSAYALARAERRLELPHEIERVRALAIKVAGRPRTGNISMS